MDTAHSSLADFNATTVPLVSSNLIEASAGTGKTYSIAILVLRLLLEKQISIKEILMVTFTKAAVAELEERIRLFVRNAYRVVEGKGTTDETVFQVVNGAIEKLGKEKVNELLHDAMVFLDETSVMTIHGFCQQTLTEFAFETNQLFGVEIVSDISLLVEDEVNQFWRENITRIPAELLKNLLAMGLSRNMLKEVIKNQLEGKVYIGYQASQQYSFPEEEQTGALARLSQLLLMEKECLDGLCRKVTEKAEELKSDSLGNSNARRYVLPLIDQPEAFLSYIRSKKNSTYIQQLFQEWIDGCDELDKLADERVQFLQSVLDQLYSFAVQHIQKNIAIHKHRSNILTFSDLIVNMHDAVVKRENEKLIAALQQKYKAVFIDEFQDSDRLQYEIFQKAFGENTILFYIGDPKQSIYAWRQADINTYFRAYNDVSVRYGMNTNYRSSAPFIQALNLFFKPDESFDTFYFKDKPDAIGYIDVDSPQPNTKGTLCRDGHPEVPITVFEQGNKSELIQSLTAQVVHLLRSGSYQIVKGGQEVALRPSDIGILVKTNAQAREIKVALIRNGVLAVTIDDNKVLQSEEARYLAYLLTAFIKNKVSHIHKALLSPFTGYSRENIMKLDREEELERFKGYGMLWRKEGIYVTLMRFLTDYSVKSVVLQQDNGERMLTNIFQLIEILHHVQSRKKLSDLDLLHWLERGIEGMAVEGDEYEQRIESDDEAVKIVTIHKSKGLEYPVVFAPFLDLSAKPLKDRFYGFRDKDGDYLFAASHQLDEGQLQLWKEQEEQEYRRLIYVSVTRAIYACYIYRNTFHKDSSLLPFVSGLKALPDRSTIIQIKDSGFPMPDVRSSRGERWNSLIVRKADHFELAEKYWRRLSYTFLASKNSLIRRDNSHGGLNEYDFFVFKQLMRGSLTGNMLHDVLENIDFSKKQYWEKTVAFALRKFMPHQLDLYMPRLLELMEHLSHALIRIGDHKFKLHEVPKSRQLTELEFDFNVHPFNTAKLNALVETYGTVQANYHHEIEGVMNGKIDLFFEYQGRYYVLDWKSNFLGDSRIYYQTEYLRTAMNDHNYHLQYLIYTLAAKKYLQQRIPNFDYGRQFGGVIYVFLRGVRAETEEGVFTYKPTDRQILALEDIFSS